MISKDDRPPTGPAEALDTAYPNAVPTAPQAEPPPRPALQSDGLVRPGDLLALRSPWLRDIGPTHVTPEGFTQHEPHWVPEAEAVQRDADALRGTSSASKLLAGQLVAHHVLHGLVLPDCVLRALAVALGLQARHYDTRIRRAAVERAYAEGKTTAEIAEAMGLDTRSVRRLRGREVPESFDVADACERAVGLTARPPRQHDERQDDAEHMTWSERRALWDIVADLTERGLVLPDEVFHATVVALGLTDGRSRLRQQVIEDVLPERKPDQVVVGVLNNCQVYGLRDELPTLEDADAEFLVHERPVQPRIGVRKRRDEYRQAVEFEAAARAKRFDAGDLTQQVLTAGQLARKLKRTDLTVIKNWIGNEQFRFDAYSLAFEMTASRRAAMSKVMLAEARAIVRGEPKPSIESLAALAGVGKGVIATWRARGDWPQRLESAVERAPAHWSDSRS